jgi:heptosyltransferase-1
MRVLLAKTSSMGDIIHTLPALTDAAQAIPEIRFDWLIEPSFAEIPAWHPQVDRIIPVALRRWRKEIFSARTRKEWGALRDKLSEDRYDMILDAQGLVKSAILMFAAQGTRVGLDWASARESLASLIYQRKCRVNFYQHAVVRMRELFSKALEYPLPSTPPTFGLHLDRFRQFAAPEKYIVFLHGTTWTSKQWPESYWQQLAKLVSAHGYRIRISGGNPAEVARAERIAASCPDSVDVMPYLKIAEMAALLANAQAAIAVDTGFGHLAAAMGVPTVSIYGSTNPEFTSALGDRSVHLAADFSCAPCLARECTYRQPSAVSPACYSRIPPDRVWSTVLSFLSSPRRCSI